MNAAVLLMVSWIAASGADAVDAGIVHRTRVPADGAPQGEVRIVRHGGDAIVQTVLHSKVLRRVAGKIAQKEARAWPPGTPGAADSERYVAALREAVDNVRAADRGNTDDSDDRHRDLCIEFLVDEGRGRVLLSGAEVIEEDATLRLVASRPPAVSLDLSEDYVRRNMVLIVSDSFGTTDEEAKRMLAGNDAPGDTRGSPAAPEEDPE